MFSRASFIFRLLCQPRELLYTIYPIVARALGLAAEFVYKIPYRRAPRLACRLLGRVRRASKDILHTTAECEREQKYLEYNVNSFTVLISLTHLTTGDIVR